MIDRRSGIDLFVISFLALFMELALIRWVPAHVLYLTFFTNCVLLASFLGLSLGCLAVNSPRPLLAWTAPVLAVTMALAQAFGLMWRFLQQAVAVGNQAQFVFFGAEAYQYDLARVTIPVEVIGGLFFVLIALCFLGPGQELGRRFKQVPRIPGYTLNILGSMAGIAVFTAASWLELPPFWWFLLVAALVWWLLGRGEARPPTWRWGVAASLAAVVAASTVTSWDYWSRSQLAQGRKVLGRHLWSPYYRINYLTAPHRAIVVNLIGHQGMIATSEVYPAYALPYILRRDAGYPQVQDVLIIGAGSGNDVARALQWGASSIDAVEIDPTIYRLGREDHPDRPYQDPRVRVHINDGRNFLKAAGRKYDLIIYALVDSLVLHSSYSNIRLESFLFTRQAFQDAKNLLKPGGQFMMYNAYRQGWVISRMCRQLREVFGTEPLVMSLPHQDVIPAESPAPGYAMVMAGDTGGLKRAFERSPRFAATSGVPLSPKSPNGFQAALARRDSPDQVRLGLSSVAPAALDSATDDWPFLYLKRPMIPPVSLRTTAVMALAAAALLWLFVPRAAAAGPLFNGRMFFLGAGFMLLETKAVVHMALLFGGTWMVNTVVFFSILGVILLANLLVLWRRPGSLVPWYGGLLAALGINSLVPLDVLLGLAPAAQFSASSLLVVAPIFFAGVIFAASFEASANPDRDFGVNVAGAMFGGLAENASMLLGFGKLLWVAFCLYALSAAFRRSAPRS